MVKEPIDTDASRLSELVERGFMPRMPDKQETVDGKVSQVTPAQ
jgi:hypothetical protein